MAETIKFLCPKCKKKIRVPGQYGGKRGGCPACKEFIDIPTASTLPDGDLPALEAKEPGAAATASSSKRAAVQAPQEIVAPAPELIPADEPEPATVVSDVQEQESFIKKDAPAEAPKSAFIKFACPGCGKMTGFPSNMAGTPASCPTCKVKLMVPEKNGEESFILGGTAAPAKPAAPKAAAPKPRPRFDPAAMPAPAVEAPAPGGFPVKIVAVAAVVLVAVLVGVLIGMKGKGGDEKQTAQNTAQNTTPAQPSTPSQNTQTAKTESHAQEPAQTKTSAPEPVEAKTILPQPEPAKTEAHAKTEESSGPFANPGKTLEETKTQAAPAVVEAKTTEPAKTVTGNNEEEDIDVNKKPKTDVAMPAQGEKTTAPENVPPKVEPPKPAQPTVVCTDCLGTGFMPVLPPRPYVRLGTDPMPNPAVSAPWTWCAKCQKAHKNDELLKAETDRLSASLNRNKMWNQKTGLQLLYVETKNVSLHANLPPAMAKKTGDALDKLVAHLQTVTRSTLLTQSRPEDHEILIAFDTPSYNKIIDMFEKDSGEDWTLARQSSGSFGRHRGFFNAKTGNPTPPDHMALYQFANMMMQEATGGKAPPWLTAGFSAYCEKTITNLNLCYSFSYEKNEVQFGQDWDVELKKYATQGKLKTWEYIFPLSGIGMSSLDYLTCYSMVSYFMKSDPRLFQQVLLNIKDGMESGKAIEKVYKRPVRDLQMMWAQWAMR